MPDLNLDKLRAVSKTMAEAIENKSGYDAVVLSKAEWEAIKDDLLRLAEEVEALKEKRESETDAAYKGGKQDGYQEGHDDAVAGDQNRRTI